MSTLVFDIETVGEDFNALDGTSQELLTKWIKKDSRSASEYEFALTDLKAELGFSPLTGSIVAIGVLDVEKDRGAVYYQTPGADFADIEDENIVYRAKSEKEMLQSFWEGVAHYDTFVSFNGRAFDVPYLMVRSAVHKIKPTKNLLANRYLNYQRDSARHVDLLDQLSFYGALRRKGSLHLWCRALGIKSPKADGVTGHDVADLFREKRFLEIAKYNVGDLVATKELYSIWLEYFNV
jgi:DNA polymerase elongation subunit (family B)